MNFDNRFGQMVTANGWVGQIDSALPPATGRRARAHAPALALELCGAGAGLLGLSVAATAVAYFLATH